MTRVRPTPSAGPVPDPRRAALRALLVPAVVGCGPGSPARLPEAELLSVPARAGAAEPSVSAWGDKLVVSWIEPDTSVFETGEEAAGSLPRPGAHALRF